MKNNKGFTLLELVLGLVLIVVVILPVFTLIVNFKNKEVEETNKADLLIYKDKVLTDIGEDITKYGIQFTCEAYDVNAGYTKNEDMQRFIFVPNTYVTENAIRYADMIVNRQEKTMTYIKYIEDTSKENKTYIVYKKNTYVVPVKSAEFSTPINSDSDKTTFFNRLELGSIKTRENESVGTVFQIRIPIKYNDKDYGIMFNSTYRHEELNVLETENLCGENLKIGKDMEQTEYKFCPYGQSVSKDGECQQSSEKTE